MHAAGLLASHAADLRHARSGPACQHHSRCGAAELLAMNTAGSLASHAAGLRYAISEPACHACSGSARPARNGPSLNERRGCMYICTFVLCFCPSREQCNPNRKRDVTLMRFSIRSILFATNAHQSSFLETRKMLRSSTLELARKP
jgi:hypothetical protein